jgi:hypothetical protein
LIYIPDVSPVQGALWLSRPDFAEIGAPSVMNISDLSR